MITMRKSQEEVAEFDKKRWKKDPIYIKDFLLNMVEETGEAWNIIKWVDAETQKKLIKEHKDKFKDFVGDQLFIILKIAYLLDIDAQQAFEATMKEYEKRFPVDKVKKLKHGNPLAGGVDDKQKSE